MGACGGTHAVRAGVGVLVGQTGGYLVGFLAAQPVIHGLIRRSDRTVRGWGCVNAGLSSGMVSLLVEWCNTLSNKVQGWCVFFFILVLHTELS